jgi:hypothetical protein
MIFWWWWMAVLVGVISPSTLDPSEKAMDLLWSWLTPAQRRDFSARGHFYVTGSVTGKTYRINKAVAPFNVEELDAARMVKRRLCFIPRGTNFTGDVMLAQKVGLEKMETTVLEVANDYDNWPGRYTDGRMGRAGIET